MASYFVMDNDPAATPPCKDGMCTVAGQHPSGSCWRSILKAQTNGKLPFYRSDLDDYAVH